MIPNSRCQSQTASTDPVRRRIGSASPRDSGRRRSATGAALLVLALIAAACADRGPDPSFSAAEADSTVDAAAPPVDSSSAQPPAQGDEVVGETEGSGETDEGGDSTDPVMWGTLESPCGPGDASGATDLGVTDDAIQVGTLADPGFSGNPGLNQELFDSAETFAAWCNEQGGILGRELNVELRDAALFDYLARIEEACAADFALVGGGGSFDDQGAQARVDCELPEVAGFSVTPEATGADLNWQSVPNPVSSFAVGQYRYLADEAPEATQAVGIMYPNIGTTVLQKDRTVEALEQLGFNVVYESSFLATGEANWTPFVIAMRDEGVEMFTYVGGPDALAGIQQAMVEQGWFPEVTVVDASFYNASFAATNEAAEGMLVRVVIVPFEESADNPATQLYLDRLEATVGSDPTTLGVQGISSFLLFATAAKACGSDLTRACLAEQLDQVTEWTGGGLHAVSNPAENAVLDCVAMLEIADGGYVRRHPAESGAFDCDPENVVALTGDYGEGATIGG